MQIDISRFLLMYILIESFQGKSFNSDIGLISERVPCLSNCIFKCYGCSNIFQLAKKNNIAYIQNMNLNILLFESNLASTLGLYVSNESLGPLNSPYIGPIFCLIYLFLIWNGSIFHSWLAHVMIDRLKLSHIWRIYGIALHFLVKNGKF